MVGGAEAVGALHRSASRLIPGARDGHARLPGARFVRPVVAQIGPMGGRGERLGGALGAAIVQDVKEEGGFTLPSFGTFTVRKITARKALNPRTGEPVKVKAGKRCASSPARTSRGPSSRQAPAEPVRWGQCDDVCRRCRCATGQVGGLPRKEPASRRLPAGTSQLCAGVPEIPTAVETGRGPRAFSPQPLKDRISGAQDHETTPCHERNRGRGLCLARERAALLTVPHHLQ